MVNVNRTIKIRLESDKALIDTCREFSRACNFAVDVAWDLVDSRFDLHHLVYKPIRKGTKLSAQLTCNVVAKVWEAVKGAGKYSKPSFKDVASVRYDARSYWVDLKEGRCSISTLEGRKKYSFNLPDYYTKYLSWDVVGGELVQDYKGRMWLHTVVSKEVSTNTCSTSAVHKLGVDLGVNNLAVTSDRHFFKGVSNTLNKVERLVGRLQRKGTKSAKRHLKKLSRRRQLFMRDVNHKVSRQIVDGLSTGDVIVLENLKNIRRQKSKGRRLNRLLNRWSFNQLQTFLSYKAEEKGVGVEFINPRYTSQLCSVCGQKGNRQRGFFSCDCGYSGNADLNASLNIRERFNPSGNESWAVVNPPIVSTLVSHC